MRSPIRAFTAAVAAFALCAPAAFAAVEPTPGVPPSPSYLATLTQRMREARVKLLIAEPYSNASVVSQVAARSGARAVTLIDPTGVGRPAGKSGTSSISLV